MCFKSIQMRLYLINFSSFSDDSMENFIKEVLAASNRGVSAAKNVSGEPNWSFGQSLFFACTVITTIGKYLHG